MQVLSQLSYNPTCFVSVHSLARISGATRPDSSPDCSTGEFRAPPTPGLHRSRLAVDEVLRVLIPRQRIGREDSTRAPQPSIRRRGASAAGYIPYIPDGRGNDSQRFLFRALDTSHIFTI